MSAPSNRRGFLRGLVSLPLIGGGVTLIGAPSAVAEPVTSNLLWNYETWLHREVHAVAREFHPGINGTYAMCGIPADDWHTARFGIERPSARAALVLAAVGCDWREGGR